MKTKLPTQPGSHRIFLTADERYGHENIIKYSNRPFVDVPAMDAALIVNHNAVVADGDRVIHVGDTCLKNAEYLLKIISQLKGKHYFMDGSHDQARHGLIAMDVPREVSERITLINKLFEFKYGGYKITLCHYAMAKWWCSHHGALHFFGHSHGGLHSSRSGYRYRRGLHELLSYSA